MIQKRKLATMSVAVLTAAALLAGCGADKDATKAPVAVNTYKVVASDTPVRAEYSGTVSAMDKVPVQPKISGRVVENTSKAVRMSRPVRPCSASTAVPMMLP